MKQLVILSGKGGTGKTSVSASFAHLTCNGSKQKRALFVDADVDASNLELLLSPRQLEEHEFIGGSVAVIDDELCESNGICADVCRFDAIHPIQRESKPIYQIDPIACEGCASCAYQCPTQAIHMQPQIAGVWYRSETPFGPLFHARLQPGQENSGKLVAIVREQSRLLALDENYQVVIIDGPPGIGCPVISAVTGADLALIVTEPTIAGVHDLNRIFQTTEHFQIRSFVCINKADIYPPGTRDIEAYCQAHDTEMVGKIPFDPLVTRAMINAEPVSAYKPLAPVSRALAEIWERIVSELSEE